MAQAGSVHLTSFEKGMSLSNWLDDFEDAMFYANVPEDRYHRYLRGKLGDDGRDLIRDLDDDTKNTWQTLKAAISLGLTSATDADLALMAIRKRTQNPEEGLKEFARALRLLFKRAHPDMNDAPLERLIFAHFIGNVTSPAKEYFLMAQPNNINDAITQGDKYLLHTADSPNLTKELLEKISTLTQRLEAVENKNARPFSPAFSQPAARPPTHFTQRKFPTNNNTGHPPQTTNSLTCYFCRKPGHIKPHCPLLKQFARLISEVDDNIDTDVQIDNNEQHYDDQFDESDFVNESVTL
jgi:hypothetical protein